MTNYRPEPDRFFEKVDKRANGCWIWTGAVTTAGYGSFRRSGRAGGKTGSHRWSYEYHKGAIPEGMVVDHMCFTPACVNPDHLRLATSKQNSENFGHLHAHNTTGYRGVWFCKRTQRFVAQVKVNRKNRYLGSFTTAEEAGEVALQERLRIHTHNLLDRQSS